MGEDVDKFHVGDADKVDKQDGDKIKKLNFSWSEKIVIMFMATWCWENAVSAVVGSRLYSLEALKLEKHWIEQHIQIM